MGVVGDSEEWSLKSVDPETVIVLKPATKWKKAGSLSNVHHRKVGGDQRDMGVGVGGSVNTQHHGPTCNRPTERIVENRTT